MLWVFVFVGLGFYPYFVDAEADGSEGWIGIYLIFFLMLGVLLNRYSRCPQAIIIILFSMTYVLGPLPFLIFGVPIVPYVDNIKSYNFIITACVFIQFYAALLIFSEEITNSPYSIKCMRRTDMFVPYFWPLVGLFMFLFFKGEPVVNSDGRDMFETYKNNLDNQSGVLEYFFAIMALGLSLSVKNLNKLLFVCFSVAYAYFCFSRGYRIQMIEMLVMCIGYFFINRLTLSRIVLLGIIAFIALQIHGSLKHGAEDIFQAASIFSGEEMRTNQTEVFYTSNNVINSIYDGSITLSDRIDSLGVAIIATFVPAGLLPDIWHPSVHVFNITGLPAGGGGFISGHYFYWLSNLGILLSGFLVALFFKKISSPKNDFQYFLTLLIFTTFPRWIAYEPIALFFRLGLYFSIMWFIVYKIITPAVLLYRIRHFENSVS